MRSHHIVLLPIIQHGQSETRFDKSSGLKLNSERKIKSVSVSYEYVIFDSSKPIRIGMRDGIL